MLLTSMILVAILLFSIAIKWRRRLSLRVYRFLVVVATYQIALPLVPKRFVLPYVWSAAILAILSVAAAFFDRRRVLKQSEHWPQ